MVNPGGTGNPALVISARPAPLPPSTSFIFPLPSALPPPNEYTYLVAEFFAVEFFCSAISASGRVMVAIISPFCSVAPESCRPLCGAGVPLPPRVHRDCLLRTFRHHLREIGDRGEFFYQRPSQGQPVGPQIIVVHHHHHFVEKPIDRRPQPRNLPKRLLVVTRRPHFLDRASRLGNRRRQLFLRFLHQRSCIQMIRNPPLILRRLPQNILHALECNRNRLEVSRPPHLANRLRPRDSIDHIVRIRSQQGIHNVIRMSAPFL